MVTLDRLVNVLGSYGVRLRFCPIPRSTELRSVVLHEVTEDRTVVGDVLLGIGARSVKEAVRWAAAARAVVVLIRGGDDDDTTFGGADEGVAVMVVDPAVSWSELAAVIYGLVLEGRETESGRGPTDLFALADSLAEATGGAVIIEDRLSRVLAYSQAAATRRPGAGGDHHRATGTGAVARILRRPWRVRTSGGLRRTAVRRRGPRSRHDRAHGGRGAVGTRTHGIGVGGVQGAVGRGRAQPRWPTVPARWPCTCCAREPAPTWNARSNPNW